jgi:hypothetical protein
METISRGGRPVAGFVGAATTSSPGVSPAYAAIATGATVGLLAYVLKAPAGWAVLIGSAGALVTKVGIDAAAA